MNPVRSKHVKDNTTITKSNEPALNVSNGVKYRLWLVILLSILLLISMGVFFLLAVKPKPGLKPFLTKSDSAERTKQQQPPSSLPVSSEQTQPKAEIKGPFPVDNTVPERLRQIGNVMNAWRQAIIIKNINDIKHLELAIKSYGQEAIPFLRKLALEDDDERVRAFATRVLGRKNLPELSSLFLDLLHNDNSPFVRENAAWALGRLGDPKVIDVLQKVADSDNSEQVRQTAQESINIIKSTGVPKEGEDKDEQEDKN